MVRARPSVLCLTCALVLGALACDATTGGASGADFGGGAADAHCDRRFVTDGGLAASFCQEIAGTLVASQFADNCRDKHQAAAGPGLCPRSGIIAGCKLDTKNADNSVVRDWYYDVSSIVAEAGSGGGSTFDPPVPTTIAEVGKTCADRVRYADGAELIAP
jgi:hypothetical protein